MSHTCRHNVLPWTVSQQQWPLCYLLHIEPGIENCLQGRIPEIKTFIYLLSVLKEENDTSIIDANLKKKKKIKK